MDRQEMETNIGGYKNNRLDKENGFESYIREFGLTKRQKEIGINLDSERGIKKQRWIDKRQKQIQVVIRYDRKEIKIDTGGQIRIRLR